MKTLDQLPATDPDLEAIIQSLVSGKPIPMVVRDRLRAEGRKLTQQLRDTVGETNMAVDLIRETRDE